MSQPTTPTTKVRSKPSYYTPLQFHSIRAISAISSIIVSGILLFFCIELKNEGYNIPWTFLIVLLASILTLLCLTITASVHCCLRLSPTFSLVLNIPLLLLWIVGAGLFTYNIYGTLAHSCSLANWASDDGVMVCSEYKALFSFVVFGTLAQVAMIVLDVRARRAQTRSGKYAKMNESELKLEPYDSTHANSVSGNSVHDAPYMSGDANERYQYRDEQPGWKPGQGVNTSQSQDVMLNDYEPRDQHGDVGTARMDGFQDNHDVYQRPTYQTYQPYQTGYDAGHYVQRY